VILYSDREAFDRAAERFRSIVEKYQAALRDALSKSRSDFEQRIICEFGPRWEQNPPRFFARWRIGATPQNIGAELQRLAREIFESAVSFDDRVAKIPYKNVAPENLRETAFVEVLRKIMLKRRVPREIIDSLFDSGKPPRRPAHSLAGEVNDGAGTLRAYPA
jgi:hypothetical protein